MAKPADRKPVANWKEIFIAALEKSPNVAAAARKAKISRQYAYAARKDDAGFAAAWDEALESAIDVLLGLILAVKSHDLSAQAAWQGMTKKIVSLLLVATAALLNPHIQGIIEINLTQAASAFYLVPELTSITRNAAALDVPVFTQMKDILRYFQSRNDNSAK